MSLIIPDLTKAVTIGGVSLNNATVATTSGRSVTTGSRVDYMIVHPAEVVQFTEKLALANGLDYGPAYLGGRLVEVRGVSEAATRGETFDLVSAIEAACQIVSGGFGLVALTFTALSGAGGSPSTKTLQVRPNGLIVPSNRDIIGGLDDRPLAIEWSFTALAMNPAVS